MPKVKTQEEKLWGAAVVKASFALRDALESPAFKGIYPGLLRDLGVCAEDVDAFLEKNRARVEQAAKGGKPDDS